MANGRVFQSSCLRLVCVQEVCCMRDGNLGVMLSLCFQFSINFPYHLSLCSKNICTYDTLLHFGCIHNVVLRKKERKKKRAKKKKKKAVSYYILFLSLSSGPYYPCEGLSHCSGERGVVKLKLCALPRRLP